MYGSQSSTDAAVSPKRKVRQNYSDPTTFLANHGRHRRYSSREEAFEDHPSYPSNLLNIKGDPNEGKDETEIRGANSLESLDSVTSYVHQVRVTAHNEPPRMSQLCPMKNSERSRDILRCPSNHQNTFPLQRRSLVTDEDLLPHSLRKYNAKDRSGNADVFWSPGFSRKRYYASSSLRGRSRGTSILSEEKAAGFEIQKLRRELSDENGKVERLSLQLSTNAQVVSAFEQSLANMANRLSQLTHSANQKDKELQELRSTIDAIRSSNRMPSNNMNQQNSDEDTLRWKSDESVSFNSDSSSGHHSKSLKFMRSKKTSWIRSSLNKAFRRSKGSASELECSGTTSKDCETGTNVTNHHRSLSAPILDDPVVMELQRQLNAKEEILTETRLEALSSASQLQNLRETVAKLRKDLDTVRKDNEMLQKKLEDSEDFSQEKLHSHKKAKTSIEDPASSSILCVDCRHNDSEEIKSVNVTVQGHSRKSKMIIGCLLLAIKSKFTLTREDLEAAILSTFDLYIKRLDPEGKIGLVSTDSVESYEYCGTQRLFKDNELEDGNSSALSQGDRSKISSADVSNMEGITLYLKGLHDLSFWTIISLERLALFIKKWKKTYLGIISGLPGSGKSFLAKKLCQYICLRSGQTLSPSSVSVFWAGENGSVEDCSRHLDEILSSLPKIILLENFHRFPVAEFESQILPKIRRISEKRNSLILMTSSNSSFSQQSQRNLPL